MKDLISRLLDSIAYAPVVTITPIFAWYDFWIGVFIDQPKRRIYIFPLPMCGLCVSWRWEALSDG